MPALELSQHFESKYRHEHLLVSRMYTFLDSIPYMQHENEVREIGPEWLS